MAPSSSTVRVVLVVAAAVVLIVGGGFGYLIWDFMRPDASTEEHELHYTLIVEPDADLTNVSIVVPIPVIDENLTAAVVAAARAEFPTTTTIAVVNTTYGPMLAIEADRLPARFADRTPAQPSAGSDAGAGTGETVTATPRPVLNGYIIDVRVPVDHRIDTQNPTSGEPTLQPRFDDRERECHNPRSSATCTEFDSRVRLDYDAPDDAMLYLTVHLEGSNTWFAGGWTGNSYSQYLSSPLIGPHAGWYTLTVSEETGGGNYRWPGGEAMLVDRSLFGPHANTAPSSVLPRF